MATSSTTSDQSFRNADQPTLSDVRLNAVLADVTKASATPTSRHSMMLMTQPSSVLVTKASATPTSRHPSVAS